MRDAWIMSARADMRVSPKKSLSNEKTRSAAAEFGVKEKTIRAAAAQVGNLLPLLAHQARTDVVNAAMSLWSITQINFRPLWTPNLNYLEAFGSIWFSPKPKVFGIQFGQIRTWAKRLAHC